MSADATSRKPKDDTFVVFKPASFEIIKSEKGGKNSERTFGGYCSTDALDRQGETVFQKGLDFSEFLQHGYFNDNHNQSTKAALGVPDMVRYDLGKGWFTQGHLFKTKAADEILELAKALQDEPRKLGFSIEGKVIERENNRIKKALIRNVAITNCPVNTNCSWDLLNKAFTVGLDAEDVAGDFAGSSFIKSLAAGTGPGARTATSGGRVLVGEDLEKDEVTHVYKCTKCDKGFAAEGGLDDHMDKKHGKTKKSSLHINTFEPTEMYRTSKGMTAQEAVRLIKSVHPEWSDLVCVRAARFALTRVIAQKGGE